MSEHRSSEAVTIKYCLFVSKLDLQLRLVPPQVQVPDCPLGSLITYQQQPFLSEEPQGLPVSGFCFTVTDRETLSGDIHNGIQIQNRHQAPSGQKEKRPLNSPVFQRRSGQIREERPTRAAGISGPLQVHALKDSPQLGVISWISLRGKTC